ncbi:hypothetical protein C8Q80DRAFT_1350963 [Daedaleopsis nitida]|nr:hypothetical protein C8Q80DRAFT_1350963 [Daedaleopsis nitida]
MSSALFSRLETLHVPADVLAHFAQCDRALPGLAHPQSLIIMNTVRKLRTTLLPLTTRGRATPESADIAFPQLTTRVIFTFSIEDIDDLYDIIKARQEIMSRRGMQEMYVLAHPVAAHLCTVRECPVI